MTKVSINTSQRTPHLAFLYRSPLRLIRSCHKRIRLVACTRTGIAITKNKLKHASLLNRSSPPTVQSEQEEPSLREYASFAYIFNRPRNSSTGHTPSSDLKNIPLQFLNKKESSIAVSAIIGYAAIRKMPLTIKKIIFFSLYHLPFFQCSSKLWPVFLYHIFSATKTDARMKSIFANIFTIVWEFFFAPFSLDGNYLINRLILNYSL